jgi:hypothetical protein
MKNLAIFLVKKKDFFIHAYMNAADAAYQCMGGGAGAAAVFSALLSL